MPETCTCWKCGGPLPELLSPLPRLEDCPHCRAQLHVCRMCVFFAADAPQQCREPVADPVSDKQRANFCGYFQLNPQAGTNAPERDAASRRELDALFGATTAATAAEPGSAADALCEQLEQLFRK